MPILVYCDHRRRADENSGKRYAAEPRELINSTPVPAGGRSHLSALTLPQP